MDEPKPSAEIGNNRSGAVIDAAYLHRCPHGSFPFYA